MLHLPPGLGFAFSLVVLKGYGGDQTIAVTQILCSHAYGLGFNQNMWFRTMGQLGNGTDYWQDWEKIATNKPPTEYPLPLVEGVSGTGRFYQDQFGRVYNDGTLGNSNTQIITNGFVLGKVPVGYRPASDVQRPAIFLKLGGQFVAGTIIFTPTGEVIAQTAQQDGMNWVYYQATYGAAIDA